MDFVKPKALIDLISDSNLDEFDIVLCLDIWVQTVG